MPMHSFLLFFFKDTWIREKNTSAGNFRSIFTIYLPNAGLAAQVPGFGVIFRVYDDLFATKFGFWRPHIEKVIYRFLDCGEAIEPDNQEVKEQKTDISE